MDAINLEVKRTGFPIKIGTLEFWFDTRLEHLKDLANAEQVVTDKLNALKEDIIKSKLSDLDVEISAETTVNADVLETLEGGLDLFTKKMEIEYDVLLGEGAFKKLYSEYPDAKALSSTLETLYEHIGIKLDELQIEYRHLAEQQKQKYQAKKEDKRKV